MKPLNVLVTNWRAAGGLGWVGALAEAVGADIWIKAYDGTRWLDLGAPFAEIAHQLQERGLNVGAWGYHYGHLEEADRLIECWTYRHGLDGYEGPRAGLLIDAESEFESADGRSWADAQVKRILAKNPSVPVYYTSFAFPELHSAFPYDVFNLLSGGHVPQVYYNHQGWRDPASSVAICVAQHLERRLKVPGVMLPIYDAGSESGWRPSPEDFHMATLAADMYRVPSVWTWTWEQHGWPDWVALRLYSRITAGGPE